MGGEISDFSEIVEILLELGGISRVGDKVPSLVAQLGVPVVAGLTKNLLDNATR